MRLSEVETQEEMEASLKEGDRELWNDIMRAVSHAVDASWENASPEWDLGMELEELTSMVDDALTPRHGDGEAVPDYSTLVDYLGTNAAAELEGLPAATVEQALRAEVQEAAERSVAWTTRGRSTPGSTLLSFTSGQGGGLTMRPVYLDLYVSFESPLSWVPEEQMLEALKVKVPEGSAWEAREGDDAYSSGWVDSYDCWRLEVDHNKAQEWAYDVRQEHLSNMVDADPDVAIAEFMAVLNASYPAIARKVKKAKLPKDLLADYAVAYFGDPATGLQIIAEAMGEWGYPGSRGEVLLELDRAALQAMRITEGKWWDGAPWRLVDLPAEELAYEGTLMRHCVGRFDFGYRSAVEAGTTRIWSLRSRHNKPVLTFEIDAERWRNAGEWPAERGGAIQQLKGKLNRQPGVADLQERAVLHWIFARLDIDAAHVPDLGWRVDNPGFNAPWRSYQERAHARLLRY